VQIPKKSKFREQGLALAISGPGAWVLANFGVLALALAWFEWDESSKANSKDELPPPLARTVKVEGRNPGGEVTVLDAAAILSKQSGPSKERNILSRY